MNKAIFQEVIWMMMLSLMMTLPVYSKDTEHDSKPLDGRLLLPDGYNKAKEQTCLTVCGKWGENCIINPATGNRKCRRVCESFVEECFEKKTN